MKLLKTQDELERMLLERLHAAGYPRAQRPKLAPIELPGEWEVVVLSLGHHDAVVPWDVKRIIDAMKDHFAIK